MSLDAVAIVSQNPSKSIEFFKLLGIELKQYEESGHFEAVTPSGLRIMMDSENLIRSFEPSWKKIHGTGIMLCFKQESAAKVDEVFKRITDAGFKGIKKPWDAFWGQRYACVSDPDGNQVDVFAIL